MAIPLEKPFVNLPEQSLSGSIAAKSFKKTGTDYRLGHDHTIRRNGKIMTKTSRDLTSNPRHDILVERSIKSG